MTMLRIWVVGLAISVVLAPAALADALDKAIYMNTYYCAGIAEVYGQLLSASHRSEAGEAGQAAVELKSRAQSFGRRLGYSGAEGRSAETQGRQTMARMLPQGGAWSSGGPIPRDAFRQYKHCASLAGM
jgi:hypothetical protein